jgi:hypothetical protein
MDNSFGISTSESINGVGFGNGISDNEYWGLTHFLSFNNDGNVTGDPNTDEEFLFYLSGIWRDVTPVLCGENSYPSSGSSQITSNFLFPGDSDPLFFGTGGITVPNWTETTSGNTPADRRGIGSSGPVTFSPGEVIELQYAFVIGRGYMNAGVDNMLERADSTKSYFDQGLLNPCGDPLSVNNSIKKESQFAVYPNPVKDITNITQEGNLTLKTTLIDVTEKVVKTVTSSNSSIQINTTSLSKGVYVARINGANIIENKIIVKE